MQILTTLNIKEYSLSFVPGGDSVRANYCIFKKKMRVFVYEDQPVERVALFGLQTFYRVDDRGPECLDTDG